MKKLLVVGALVLGFSFFAEAKFAAVDMLKLVEGHPSFGPNREYLKTKHDDCQKKLDVMKQDLEKVQEEGRVKAEALKNPMLSQAAKEKVEKELVDIQQKFISIQQALRAEAMRNEKELQDDEQRFLKITTDMIRGTVSEYARTHGYDVIFDAGSVPYLDPELDVTADILKLFSAGAAASAAIGAENGSVTAAEPAK